MIQKLIFYSNLGLSVKHRRRNISHKVLTIGAIGTQWQTRPNMNDSIYYVLALMAALPGKVNAWTVFFCNQYISDITWFAAAI